MIIEQKGFNHYLISEIKGYLIHKEYLYYTKKQAIKEFKKYIEYLKNKGYKEYKGV